MNSVEKLCVAQALYNIAGKVASTKDAGNLRAEVDEKYRELFEETGATSFKVRVGGYDVGTYSVLLTKPEKKSFLKVVERDAFMAWCSDNDCIITEPDIAKATRLFDETGELPDGCSVMSIEDDGGKWKGGTLKVDPVKVNNALGGQVIPPALMDGDAS